MRNTLLVTIGFAALGTMFVANAGPPLTCHPYNIGGAKSLPWNSAKIPGNSGKNWDDPDPSYNLKNLASDTVAILDRSSTVLVHMETLRRAVLYGAKDHDAARALLAQLKAREAASETSKTPGAAAIFDYGYFVATLKQVEFMYKENLTGEVDGYQLVQKALAIEPDSPEMHFAAAIMASFPARPSEREEHLRQARAAKNDSLLAQNLSTHFQ